MKKTIVTISMIGLMGSLVFAAPVPWVAPGGAANAQNPVPSAPETIAAGLKIFTAQCVVCHGATGVGDGPAGVALQPKPADLTKITGETDGALFWKLTNGRGPMPATKDTLTATERWEVINYVRTLKK